METARKKEILKEIRELKKRLRGEEKFVVRSSGFWDIHLQEYGNGEIAARFLRVKGYNVEIIEDLPDPRYPDIFNGYVRYRRLVVIKLFRKGVEKEAGT